MADNKCFCCDKDIDSSMRDTDPWESPNNALCFVGTGSFGSTFYDMLAYPEGVRIEVILCDECMNKNKDKIRWTKSVRKVIIEEIDPETEELHG